MKDDINRYKSLDEKFRLAAAEIPVEFDASAWESLAQQLDNIGGNSDSDTSSSNTSDGGSTNWLNTINLNTVIGLIIEIISFITLVTVIIPSALSMAQVPELKVPEEFIETVPVIVTEHDKDSSITTSKHITPTKKNEKPKPIESIAPIVEIEKDSVIQNQDTSAEDSLYIFW